MQEIEFQQNLAGGNIKILHDNLNACLIPMAEKCDINMISLLLQYGADIHYKNDFLIQWAVYKKNFEMFEFLVNKMDRNRMDRELVVRLSCVNGYTEIIKSFINKKIDVSTCDSYGLVFGSEEGHTEIVKLLLKNTINTQRALDDSLLNASKMGHLDIVELLLRNRLYNDI
jgi:ankyrin repeat protein